MKIRRQVFQVQVRKRRTREKEMAFGGEVVKREDVQNVGWGDVRPGGSSTTGRIPR